MFFFTETYAKALERAKKAENTSNVDTDQESLKRRATKRPAKFAISEDEVADGMTLFVAHYEVWSAIIACEEGYTKCLIILSISSIYLWLINSQKFTDEDDNYLEKSHTSLPVAVLPKPPHHHEVNGKDDSFIISL